jgi:hypothetical protein
MNALSMTLVIFCQVHTGDQMENSDISPLADSLVYTATLPVSWEPRDEACPDSEYARISEHNEHVLRCANLLGEQLVERHEDETEADTALMRLEAKVNLLLELVSKLEQRISQIPEASQVRLASAGMEWTSRLSPPPAGSSIWINLYIDNRIPDAMQIPARVLTLGEGRHGTIVGARFEQLGEVAQELLEKMIFRHHRRQIAKSRGDDGRQ